MRPKEKQIIPFNDISKKIIDLLKLKQGDDTLYSLSNHIGMQQGTLRRKLENPNGWNEIKYIQGILEFFSLSFRTLFTSEKPSGNEKTLNEFLSDNFDTMYLQIHDLNKLLDEIRKISGEEIIQIAREKIGNEPLFTKTKIQPDDPLYLAFKNAISQTEIKK
ncbi:MAG: hypothetical protein WAU38_14515 [Ignavibacteria bacterium]